MKRQDLERVASQLREPMKTFVRESRVRTAILITRSGQVLAHHGFAREYDVGNVAALAAATHSSSHALAELTGADQWMHLHHAGRETQLFLAPFETGGGEIVMVAIFDQDSTLGLVQLFFDRLVEAIREIPEMSSEVRVSDEASFESDLEAGIRRVLGDVSES